MRKLLCRLGFHRMTDWSYPKVIAGFHGHKQYRVCMYCNFYQERVTL